MKTAVKRVLVLDTSHRAHRIVSWQRAICMLYDGKVEVLYEYDGEVINSPSISIPMPSVVRMLKKTRSTKASIKFSRENVFCRDGFQCQYCGGEFDARNLNYDHVVPRSRGGKTCWENVVAACFPCNEAKANRTPDEAGMPLKRLPRKPAWLPVTTKRFNIVHMPEEWRVYLPQVA